MGSFTNQKETAYRHLPYIRSDRFHSSEKDSRQPTVFTHVRQPGYYACFNSNYAVKTPATLWHRGLLWHPKAGSFYNRRPTRMMQPQGTKPEGGRLYEADTLEALFKLNDKAITPVTGNRDLKPGTLAVSYLLGATGKKSIVFESKKIAVSIQHPGTFTEYIPLLLKSTDTAQVVSAGKVVLKKTGGAIKILFDASAKAILKETALKAGMQQVLVLQIESSDKLRYSFNMD